MSYTLAIYRFGKWQRKLPLISRVNIGSKTIIILRPSESQISEGLFFMYIRNSPKEGIIIMYDLDADQWDGGLNLNKMVEALPRDNSVPVVIRRQNGIIKL